MVNNIEEDKQYVFVKEGFKIGFKYTPLYSNSFSSSPRDVPICIRMSVAKKRENTNVYDGMPVTTIEWQALLQGFKAEAYYGNEISNWINILNYENINEYIKEVEECTWYKFGDFLKRKSVKIKRVKELCVTMEYYFNKNNELICFSEEGHSSKKYFLVKD